MTKKPNPIASKPTLTFRPCKNKNNIKIAGTVNKLKTIYFWCNLNFMITAIITIGMIYNNKNVRFTKSPAFIKSAIKYYKFAVFWSKIALHQLYRQTAKYVNNLLTVSAYEGDFLNMRKQLFLCRNPDFETLQFSAGSKNGGKSFSAALCKDGKSLSIIWWLVGIKVKTLSTIVWKNGNSFAAICVPASPGEAFYLQVVWKMLCSALTTCGEYVILIK